ncbi:hypothetical protein jhhlp_004969 [Lomentospora prolificans]|uniref:C2H2-type domain-containing protein n=1 Tax=Lomentospora prolificans TaxID=41688 RepID=A0A2N3N813_9PEZI|nr:hypothetical protein jhhlp_004969 [Lomentospora prolificans]
MATSTPGPATASTSPFRMTSHRCGTCDVSFSSVQEMRAHAKSQLHVENLRRRLAKLDPIAHKPSKDYGDHSNTRDNSASIEDSDASIHSDSDVEAPTIDRNAFDSTVCLFCRAAQSDLKSNLEHMTKSHGLVIHSPERLLVDDETFLSYLFLIIDGYHECIFCGTQRNNAHAIRRHMLDKSHCQFKLTATSEYADFYSKEEDKDSETQLTKAHTHPHLLSDEGTLSLSSGKILAHRSTPAPRPPRLTKEHKSATKATIEDEDARSAALISVAPGALTKSEKRDVALANRITTLSVADQNAIAHLTPAEQRATIERRDKELQSARRADRRLRTRLETLNNRNLMHHYLVTDDDGRLKR